MSVNRRSKRNMIRSMKKLTPKKVVENKEMLDQAKQIWIFMGNIKPPEEEKAAKDIIAHMNHVIVHYLMGLLNIKFEASYELAMKAYNEISKEIKEQQKKKEADEKQND